MEWHSTESMMRVDGILKMMKRWKGAKELGQEKRRSSMKKCYF
jgi:hypothetical protein